MTFNVRMAFTNTHNTTGTLWLAWWDFDIAQGHPVDFSTVFTKAQMPGKIAFEHYIIKRSESSSIRYETTNLGFKDAMGLFMSFSHHLDGQYYSESAYIGPVSNRDTLSLEFTEGATISATLRREVFFKIPCAVRCPDGTSGKGCITCHTQKRGSITVCC